MNLEKLKPLFQSEQGIILILGICLVTLLTLFLIIFYFIDPELSHKISAMVMANIVVGRVPSLSLGYASGLSHFYVIATNVYTEMILVTLLYSAFVFSYNNILHIHYLEHFFQKIQEYRIRYETLFDKYGIVGLFIFVFIPFWMTGPIVGAIIGHLIGLKDRTIMITVFIATIFAVTLWGLLLNELIILMNMINSSMIWFILVFGVILVFLVKFLRQEQK
jgi:uncharacterized membrane protein